MALDFLTNAFTGGPTQDASQKAIAGYGALPYQVQNYIQNTAAPGAYSAFQNLADLGATYQGYGAPNRGINDQLAGALAGGAPADFNPGNFQESPGYQYQLSQAIKSGLAAGNTGGAGASGNTIKAIETQGANLANQDYYNWLNNQRQNYTTNLGKNFSFLSALNAGRQDQYAAPAAALGGQAYGGEGNFWENTINPVAASYGASTAGTANALAGSAAAQQGGSQNFWNTLLGAGNIAANVYKPQPTIKLA